MRKSQSVPMRRESDHLRDEIASAYCVCNTLRISTTTRSVRYPHCMLDHVFTDAISALREAFDEALLERQAFEEHFQTDVLLGDVTWETSYGLPGEGSPPRVVAHITLVWPTWSQTIYRRWYVDGELDEAPTIEMEVVFRVQRLAEAANPDTFIGVLPEHSPIVGSTPLSRTSIALETLIDTPNSHALDVAYDGTYELSEDTLADGSSTVLDDHMSKLGTWIAGMLVRLGDVPARTLA
jgi:hypothetical protein